MIPSLTFWMARKNGTLNTAKLEARHYLHQQSGDYRKRGKGNRAWKRAAHLEAQFRQTGGLYVADFI